jgi:hypothetical protein
MTADKLRLEMFLAITECRADDGYQIVKGVDEAKYLARSLVDMLEKKGLLKMDHEDD